LPSRGVDAPLLCPAYGRGEKPEPGVHRIRSRFVPFDPEDRLPVRRALRRAARELAAEGLDLVHVQTPFVAHYDGVRLARRLGVPVVESYHTYFEQYLEHYLPFLPAPPLRRLARALTRSQARAVDRLIVPSSAMREVLAVYGVQTPMTVLPTGVRLDELAGGDGAAFRAAHGIAPDQRLLVHVGRMGHEKNVGFLLEVAACLRELFPDLVLVLAGEGPALPALRRQAEELGLGRSVRWIGYLDRQGPLLDCYRAGDAFVFASRTETQGLVLLEAMALGVPVVSTAEMGTRDLLAAGRGALVAREEVREFSAAVARVLTDRQLARRLAAEGPEVAGAWSAAAMADRLVAIYRAETEKAAGGRRLREMSRS
ncbi:MAG TPA: glycosyltransferase, partial [Thermoanaerobaculia bacterium]|nr:glycosyltransferase [Thermoanaerobaculia bacterium]